jgi:hypothetical protein
MATTEKGERRGAEEFAVMHGVGYNEEGGEAK